MITFLIVTLILLQSRYIWRFPFRCSSIAVKYDLMAAAAISTFFNIKLCFLLLLIQGHGCKNAWQLRQHFSTFQKFTINNQILGEKNPFYISLGYVSCGNNTKCMSHRYLEKLTFLKKVTSKVISCRNIFLSRNGNLKNQQYQRVVPRTKFWGANTLSFNKVGVKLQNIVISGTILLTFSKTGGDGQVPLPNSYGCYGTDTKNMNVSTARVKNVKTLSLKFCMAPKKKILMFVSC